MTEQLNPLTRKAVKNDDAIAVIVGVASYANALVPAVYADADAQVFHDYAVEKLGVPTHRIKTLINDQPTEGDVVGRHALADTGGRAGPVGCLCLLCRSRAGVDNGEHMYLLPYDGAPDLLERTAIRRDELFADIASIKPRSVTVFLDTCYSGATRGDDMLIASRPIAIRAREQAVPEGFTVMTAAAGNQTAKPLEEAKHGMFSYLMKAWRVPPTPIRTTRFQPVNFIRTSSRTSFSSSGARRLNCRAMLTGCL